ncbi:hypothetical protein M407DRAFT_220923 [Tulasnella calospora MUT 4182]|uniref:PH domain-containing protein n=1 Tax=Tulasnella calospora MUT 4182 TaxID=1051891 RepID=A0A0C3MBL5_9AGAM|nr:hypothetical protein M407DRAFT_220923 [Tulasnella calospora MUT 4182]
MASPANSNPPSVRSVERSDALFQVRLLAALRSGDPSALHPFLAEISKAKSGKGDREERPDLAALTLHLAIRCASYETIVILLGHRSISPNAVYPPESRISALHLAASLGRAEIVQLLLEQAETDDSVKDAQGRSVSDVATKEVRDVLQESHDALRNQFLTLLSIYVSSVRTSPPPEALIQLLESPRVRSIDLSALDTNTGTTLLHEAARRSDLRLIELAVRGGADVFVRDRRGKQVTEGEKGSGKDYERVKVFLRQFTNRDTTLIDSSATGPPHLKGHLNKYTNVAKGYNDRWFVLKDDMLSYYRHQDDENLACRGSISMRNAKLKASTSDRLRFEVSSNPTRAGSSAQKWYLRAEHPVEVARWTQAITRSIEFWNQPSPNPAGLSLASSVGDSAVMVPKANPTRSSLQMTGSIGSAGSDSGSVKADTKSIYASSWKSPRKKQRRTFRHGKSPSRESVESKSTAAEESGVDGNGMLDDSASMQSSAASAQSEEETAPHSDKFLLQANSTATQIELTTQLLTSLVLSPSPGASPSNRASEIKTALHSSLDLVNSMFTEYTKMVKEREEWYQRRYEREKEKNVMWEDSLGAVVGESEELEKDLLRLREERKGMRKALRASMIMVDEQDYKTIRATKKPDRALPSAPELEQEPPTPTPTAPGPSIQQPVPSVIVFSPPSERAPLPKVIATPMKDDDDDSETDEFFDAVDAGTTASMVIPAPLMSPPPMEEITEKIVDLEQYAGYIHPRERLPIANDNRPPVSLWAVLKGSIGKDLTKISFPVFFNEPTSMLQRMAEDMEFTECLDAAVAERDPHKRIAFVAAFAMSNYSSTIGRIAKPFNPMLGETFEYCRIDRQYRYVSEQVSHHPPISACWAESPSWNYYGEVDAKNKFMGKSFEIRPTGVAHADLKIPVDYVADSKHVSSYPTAPGKLGKGKVVEHYSWKKVTTNVSGFIMGSPTIDHYGEMTVINHRTGDRCVLTFKPRGWKASTACEITGYVEDAAGQRTWEIAGRWSTQLLARRFGSGREGLGPDDAIPRSTITSAGQQEYLLLWRNTEKPTMPFNLTPFAITLNDCPETTLKPYLPPTDCRLRPDQRAFENGEYERANGLKMQLEEFQRATRRKREVGELPAHRPRWFEATVEADTGERVWAPMRAGDQLEYWLQREKSRKSKGQGEWDRVDRIFGDIN